MFKRCCVLLLTGLGTLSALEATSSAAPRNAPKKAAVKGDYLILTEGIVGGFVAPHVRRQILIRPNGDKFDVFVMTQAKRTSPRAYHQGTISKKDAATLFAKLAKIGLWKLPTENPVGCEDIYKLDTSITARSGSRFWRNGGPGGCVRGQSKTKANEEQRESFQEAVVTVQRFATAKAKDKGDQKTFLTVLRSLHMASRQIKGKTR